MKTSCEPRVFEFRRGSHLAPRLNH